MSTKKTSVSPLTPEARKALAGIIHDLTIEWVHREMEHKVAEEARVDLAAQVAADTAFAQLAEKIRLLGVNHSPWIPVMTVEDAAAERSVPYLLWGASDAGLDLQYGHYRGGTVRSVQYAVNGDYENTSWERLPWPPRPSSMPDPSQEKA